MVLGVTPNVTPEVILPLNPPFVFLCKMILIIPLFPSGLYFADGLVINSTCLIEAEGICCNNWVASMFVGFPSINTRTFELPLKLNSFV